MWRFRVRGRGRAREERRPVDLNIVDAMVISALATVMDDRDFYPETMTEAAAMRILAIVREMRREAPEPLGDLIHIESAVVHHVPADTLYRALMVVHPDRVATAQLQSLVAACKGIGVGLILVVVPTIWKLFSETRKQPPQAHHRRVQRPQIRVRSLYWHPDAECAAPPHWSQGWVGRGRSVTRDLPSSLALPRRLRPSGSTRTVPRSPSRPPLHRCDTVGLPEFR